ncbi:MAG: DegV family EDD domain-containing protein [Oscillospiraceae bacterium]|nr:DegV family EDD domain-containing protein [Oscillospiraceae bacterium]
MEEKIVVTYDSGLDVDPEVVKKYGIKKLPVIIKLGVNETLDDGSIEPDEIIEYFNQENDLAVTAPPTVQDIFRFFTKFAHMGYTVIHISTSSKLSSAFEYAQSAAESFNKIHIIDSKAYSIGGMPIIMKAAQMAEEGRRSEEIVEYCTNLANRVKMHVLIGNVKYVHTSGQISLGKNALLSMLGRIPSVSIEDGYFYVKKNYSSNLEKAAVKFIDDILKDARGLDRSHFYLGHTGVSNYVLEDCRKEVKQVSDFDNVVTMRCGCSTTTHYGDGSLLLAWVEKEA